MRLPANALPPHDGLRIGLFGGSFNPAHDGHLDLSLNALRQLDLDVVWWMVSPQNPLKPKDETADFDLRMTAARKLARHPRLIVTGFEALLGTRTTAQTLARLAPVLGRADFVWLMGADSFCGLHKWHDWRQIPATLPIAVFDRPGYTRCALASPAARELADFRVGQERCRQIAQFQAPAWCFLPMPLNPQSSTALRHKSATES